MKDKYYEINIKEKYIHIRNYIKIEDINDSHIKIKLINKSIIIEGSFLIISKLDEFELLIKGEFKKVQFIND